MKSSFLQASARARACITLLTSWTIARARQLQQARVVASPFSSLLLLLLLLCWLSDLSLTDSRAAAEEAGVVCVSPDPKCDTV
jgi:hypothetical protein